MRFARAALLTHDGWTPSREATSSAVSSLVTSVNRPPGASRSVVLSITPICRMDWRLSPHRSLDPRRLRQAPRRSHWLPGAGALSEGAASSQPQRCQRDAGAFSAPSLNTTEPLQEVVELGFADVGDAVLATRRPIMLVRRVLDLEQIVQDLPDIATTAARVALTHVENYDASAVCSCLWLGRVSFPG